MHTRTSSLGLILILLLPLMGIAAYLAASYNSILGKEEEVFTAWSQVESTYQRRADLIPGLVKTVQGYAEHEKTVIQNATDARAQAAERLAAAAGALAQAEAPRAGAGADTLGDEGKMAGIARQQKEVGDRIRALMVMSEAYPQLRASDNFLALQDQLEGAENRINVARMAFNEKAGDFNAAIRAIPGNVMAALGGFKRKAYFKADEGAAAAPSVSFGQ